MCPNDLFACFRVNKSKELDKNSTYIITYHYIACVPCKTSSSCVSSPWAGLITNYCADSCPLWQETLDAAGDDAEVVTAEKEVPEQQVNIMEPLSVSFSWSPNNSSRTFPPEHFCCLALMSWHLLIWWSSRDQFLGILIWLATQKLVVMIHNYSRSYVLSWLSWCKLSLLQATKKKYMRKLEQIFSDMDISGNCCVESFQAVGNQQSCFDSF